MWDHLRLYLVQVCSWYISEEEKFCKPQLQQVKVWLWDPSFNHTHVGSGATAHACGKHNNNSSAKVSHNLENVLLHADCTGIFPKRWPHDSWGEYSFRMSTPMAIKGRNSERCFPCVHVCVLVIYMYVHKTIPFNVTIPA